MSGEDAPTLKSQKDAVDVKQAAIKAANATRAAAVARPIGQPVGTPACLTAQMQGSAGDGGNVLPDFWTLHRS